MHKNKYDLFIEKSLLYFNLNNSSHINIFWIFLNMLSQNFPSLNYVITYLLFQIQLNYDC